MGFSFHRAIKEVVNRYDIPDGLVINIDQTRLPFILLIKYTMDKKIQKPVPIANSADYPQVTGAFSITFLLFFTKANDLPSQTDRCHPNFIFSEEFNITHNVLTLFNGEKAIKLVEKILLPYIRNKKEELNLRSTKK